MKMQCATSPLERLPPELLSLVLSDKSITELVDLRTLSKYCRNAIDSAMPVRLHQLKIATEKKFNRVIEQHLEIDPTLPFHQALARFIKHRGLRDGDPEHVKDMFTFSSSWTARYSAGALAHYAAFVLADSCVKAYMQRHRRPRGGRSLAAFANVDGFQMYVGPTVDLSHESLRVSSAQLPEMYADIVDGSAELFGDLPAHPDEYDERSPFSPMGRPWWPLTRLSTFLVGSQIFWHRYRGLYTRKEVAQMFGVPALPDTDDFAYCVRSDWAYNLVQDAVYAGRALTAVEKGAVLEEMFIY